MLNGLLLMARIAPVVFLVVVLIVQRWEENRVRFPQRIAQVLSRKSSRNSSPAKSRPGLRLSGRMKAENSASALLMREAV